MAETFNHRVILRDLLTAIVSQSNNEELNLINSVESALIGKQVDHLIGGIQDHDASVSTKPVRQNALFINAVASVASYLSHSGCSQAAIMAGQFLQNYTLTNDGFYCDVQLDQNFQQNISDLQSMLTNEQWLAIKYYFLLPETGTFKPHHLKIATPRRHLSSATGLHPKQVPLALDAALSMATMLCQNNLPIKQTNNVDYAANTLVVGAFFNLAQWLHQQQFAELGQALLAKLTKIPNISPLLMLDATLASLRYQWRDNDFQELLDLVNKVIDCEIDAESQNIFTHGVNLQDLSALLSLTTSGGGSDFSTWTSYRSCIGDDLCQEISAQYKSCVIIKGPEFMARKWLQSAGNQFQFKHRFYAIPTDTRIHAISISADGEQRDFIDLNELLDYSQPSNADLHRLL